MYAERLFKSWKQCALAAALLTSSSVHAHVWIDKGSATGVHSDANAHEGTSVAMFGDLLVVGAPKLNKPPSDLNGLVIDSGGVEIYRRTPGGWSLDQTLFSPNAATGAEFGASVAISDNVLVVGEPLYSPNSPSGFEGNGRALVYVRSPTTNRYIFRKEILRLGLTHDGCANCRSPQYGSSVDVVGDGHNFAIAIGAPGEDDFSSSGSIEPDMGLVLVSRISVEEDGSVADTNDADNRWVIRNNITDSNGIHIFDRPMFGESVALAKLPCANSCDATYYLGIGAPRATVQFESGGSRQLGGAAWFYRLNSTGSATSPSDIHVEQMFVPSGNSVYLPFFLPHLTSGDHNMEFFGSAVEVRVIGGSPEFIVGSLGAVVDGGEDRAGAVYVFKRPANSCCLQREQVLRAPGPAHNEGFGRALAFAGDRLLIGAPLRGHAVNGETEQTGAVFDFEASTDGSWEFAHELYDHGLIQKLGDSVAGSTDWIATGVPLEHGATRTWQRGWNFTVNEPNAGAIRLFPPLPTSPAVDCPPDCDFIFENGRHLNPNAIPDDGFIFGNWIGSGCDAVHQSVCPIVIDGDKTLTASFLPAALNHGSLRIEIIAGSGTVSADAETGLDFVCPDTCDGIYDLGTSIELTASPAEGYEFFGWGCSVNGSPCCTDVNAPCVVTVTAMRTVTAEFRPAPGYHSVDVEFAGAGSGSVFLTRDGEVTECTSTQDICAVALPNSTDISLTACANGGSTFSGWGGACNGSGTCGLVLDGDVTVTATFDMTEILFRNGFEETVTCQPLP